MQGMQDSVINIIRYMSLYNIWLAIRLRRTPSETIWGFETASINYEIFVTNSSPAVSAMHRSSHPCFVKIQQSSPVQEVQTGYHPAVRQSDSDRIYDMRQQHHHSIS